MKKSIERDFIDALDRLSIGRPNHPELIEAAHEGRLRVSIRSVALEAGHSHSLIDNDRSVYGEVRKRILGYIEAGEPAKRARALAEERKNRVRDLSLERAESLTLQAALLVELDHVREKLDKLTIQSVPRHHRR